MPDLIAVASLSQQFTEYTALNVLMARPRY
jgi:hypothetical protein